MRELEIVAALPGSLRLGEPVASGPLTLVPVFGGQPAPTYRLAAEAIADGTLSIGEIGGGQVPQLGVRNTGELPALLVEGEHLQGAMQDRVLNVTVLVPAKADTEIPVSCVEHGRWNYRSGRRFAASPEFSPSTLRADQDGRRLGPSAVGGGPSFGPGTRVGGGRAQARHARQQLADRRDARRVRAARLGSGGDDPLVRAAAARADGRGRDRRWPSGGVRRVRQARDPRPPVAAARPRVRDGGARRAGASAEREVAERFVAAIGSAKATAHDAVGLGTEVVLTDPGFVAGALVWEGSVVHVAAFADASERSGESPSDHVAGRSWFRDRDRNGP